MQMRFRKMRELTGLGAFQADAAPSDATAVAVSLDDWVADQAGQAPTRGHALRVRFLNAAGAELLGGAVTLQVWGKTSEGFWVADAVVTGANGTARYLSTLTGDLFVQITAVSITDIPTATTLQVWVDEVAGPLVIS